MKKKVCMLSALTVLIGMINVNAGAADEVRVFVDGEVIKSDVAPQIINDRVMLPFRSVFEAMGAEVSWEDSEKRISAKNDATQLEMTIGNKDMLINSQPVENDVAPIIINDRALVPVRVCAEAFGCEVEWYGESRVVEITTKKQEEKPVVVAATGINYIEDIDPTVNYTGTAPAEGFWEASNWTKAENNGGSIVVSQIGNMPTLYEKEKVSGLVTFKMKLQDTNSWPSLIFSQQELDLRYTQTDCYLISFLDNMIQLQKFVKGARNAIYSQNEFYPKAGGAINNESGRIVGVGVEHEVTAGTIVEENGVRLVLIVDGKTIFDYLDKEKNAITNEGYFGIYAGDKGNFTFSPVEVQTTEE